MGAVSVIVGIPKTTGPGEIRKLGKTSSVHCCNLFENSKEIEVSTCMNGWSVGASVGRWGIGEEHLTVTRAVQVVVAEAMDLNDLTE